MSNCLSPDEIDRLLAGKLDAQEEVRIDAHLRGCPACLEALNAKTAVPDSVREALALGRQSGDRGSLDTDEPDQPLPPGLPGYEFIEEIGRGGLGVVFKARQLALGRIVAVKMIRPGTFPGPSELARFRLEADAVAKLQHPNIVQVFDIIDHESTPALCMEYVAGDDLAKRLGGKPQPADDAARLVEILARAIHRVHEAGFLHRDLKPANILLAAADDSDSGVWLAAPDGERANVHPKITDFGLAKQVGVESGITETHVALGTPSYMSPEQARADKDVTRAADVYSLGAILYEALAGRPPFRSSSAVETMAQVIHEDPVPPGRLVANLSVDLEAVCLKCLEKDPARRYPSAEALADDLRRVQEGQPTIARPMTATERVWRWCRRNRAVATLLAALVITLLVATTVTSVGLVRATRAESRMAIEAERATKAESRMAIEAERARHALEESHQVNGFLTIDLLQAVMPGQLGRDVRMRDVLDEAAKRIDREAGPGGRFENMPPVHAGIRYTIGNTYYALGEYAAALPHLERALLIRRETLGEEHAITLRTTSLTALVYMKLGRSNDAMPLFTTMLEIQSRTLGAEHLLTMRTTNNLALLHSRLGHIDKAEAMYRRIIAARPAVSDAERDGLHLKALGNLANAHRARGQLAEAEKLGRELLTLAKSTLGPDHLTTMKASFNLAASIYGQENSDGARSIYEPLLKRLRRVLGPEHPGTIKAMGNLGLCYVTLKRYDDAEPLIKGAIEILERKLGPNHPETLADIHNLGFFYFSQERWEDALTHFERASAGALRVWPKGHPTVSTFLGRHGETLTKLERFDEAESMLTRAHENAVAVRNDQLIVETVKSMVKLYEAWNKSEQAATWRAKLPTESNK